MDLNLNNLFLINTGLVLTVSLVLWWYAYHSKVAVLDQQDQRSLHQGRYITGAGILMFVPFCIGGLMLYPLFMPLYIILALSVLGLFDDRYGLSFQLRLLVQIAAAVLTLYSLEFLSNHIMLLFLLLSLLWWINLFNFMDGANGMAGLHALVGLVFYGLLFNNQFSQYSVFSYLTIAGALVMMVYLTFNLWLKKLFMGDSGSLPLAWVIAVMALYSLHYDILSVVQIATVHAVFIVDATLTLFHRLRLRENITQAHATHFYQRLIKAGNSHTLVSSVYALVTCCCCLLVWFTHKTDRVVQYATGLVVYLILMRIFMKYLNTGR